MVFGVLDIIVCSIYSKNPERSLKTSLGEYLAALMKSQNQPSQPKSAYLTLCFCLASRAAF
jgi:hypothetical protein